MQQCLEDDPWYQRTEAINCLRLIWAAADSHCVCGFYMACWIKTANNVDDVSCYYV